MAQDPQDPGTVDAFPRVGRPCIGDRPMTPAERKRKSRAAYTVREIRLSDSHEKRFEAFSDRLGLTPSELVAFLLDAVKLPRK